MTAKFLDMRSLLKDTYCSDAAVPAHTMTGALPLLLLLLLRRGSAEDLLPERDHTALTLLLLLLTSFTTSMSRVCPPITYPRPL